MHRDGLRGHVAWRAYYYHWHVTVCKDCQPALKGEEVRVKYLELENEISEENISAIKRN